LSIFDLVDNCHELFKIDVSYSTTLTNASIYHIQRYSTQLKKLHLDGLRSVDDSCILELMKMPKIKSIFAGKKKNESFFWF
jgi:hypothetical protein